MTHSDAAPGRATRELSMSDRPRRLLFTGDGKGKTTAALGMALRAAGRGLRVMVVQFIKADARTGEIAACDHLPGVEIKQVGMGFVPPAGTPRFAEHQRAARQGLELAASVLAAGEHDLVVLDEICLAAALGLINEGDVVAAVLGAGEGVCVVMTGRDAPACLVELADTVTHMQCVKHALSDGRKAQQGVEY